MAVFGNLFNGKKSTPNIDWTPLNSLEQLDEIVQDSFSRPQLIYKHSTTCGISSMVLRMLEGNALFPSAEANFYMLDLHRYRDISNAIANRLDVRHESPQLIIIKEGKMVTSASHGAIAEVDYAEHL